jgi:TP901 family phage tail tape measure protein
VVQWSDYTSQLGRVASISAVAGVSLDEVNAFIAAATKNGATAEVAFTGLGASLATIIKPTKESAEAAQALGINWTLAGLRGEGFESLMNQLAKAMQKATLRKPPKWLAARKRSEVHLLQRPKAVKITP